MAGTAALEIIVPREAALIKELKANRAILASEAEKLVVEFLLSKVLLSWPGTGTKTAANMLLAIGDGPCFKDAARLAALTGITRTSSYSRNSVHGQIHRRPGNQELKNALFKDSWLNSCPETLPARIDRREE